MKETDISKLTTKRNAGSNDIEIDKKGAVRGILSGIWKIILTLIMVVMCALIAVGVSIAIYIYGIATEPTGIDLVATSLNLTSFIYVQDEKTGEWQEYQSLYSGENRVWVDFQDIPQQMKDAIVAIEDKRFYEHHGVDLQRTGGAIFSLVSGTSNYGGSTLTQQLIKNLTDDNAVSLNRKIREIFRAINVEKEYTKDQILEAYLNVVNFGNNCQGCEAAAELYFGKKIQDCSIAECAAIAGITQNPSKWNPLMFPEKNKQRREIVINEMYNQNMISKEEYDKAIKESANMKFKGYNQKKEKEEVTVQNWYMDELYYDLRDDIAELNGISIDAASTKIYTEGYKVYCAMDTKMQKYIEKAGCDIDKTYDPDLQIGMTLMGYDGRVIATTGASTKKEGNLVHDIATMSALQPGSSIKPVIVYPYAIENNLLTYGSLVKDEPLDVYQVAADGSAIEGPPNWYSGYKGSMSLPDAIEISSNATAAQVMDQITTKAAYKQATQLMGFSHLDPKDGQQVGALSIGGMTGGVTVREMAAAYEYLGNGGQYYKPYTYYYVTDNDGKVIIDNRDAMPIQAYSDETAAIMNRELYYNISNSKNTEAWRSRISGWEIIGKTGTTNDDKDSWFCGCSPYATLAVWTGYKMPSTVNNTSVAASTFQKVMSQYLKGKEKKKYNFPADMQEISYCVNSGLLASSYCYNTRTGYYFKDKMPDYCYGDHSGTVYTNNDDTYGNNNNYDTDYDYNNFYNTTAAATEAASYENQSEPETQTEAPKQTEAPTEAPKQTEAAPEPTAAPEPEPTAAPEPQPTQAAPAATDAPSGGDNNN
ncbi:MAG: transglycosylase domain-containing protein [Ruminococcus sp.]|nr:transglycosylase domain-containing protein [Ruminococcus sp.]